MLQFYFLRMCRIRAIQRPYTFLRKNGFSHYVAHKIINHKYKELKITDLYKLCSLLDCTTDDLFNYVPCGKEFPGHSLYKLIKNDEPLDLYNEFKTLPQDEIEKIKQMVRKINDDRRKQME